MLTQKQLIQEAAQIRERIIDLEARVKDCTRLEDPPFAGSLMAGIFCEFINPAFAE